MGAERVVTSTEELIGVIKEDYKAWGTKTYPWFRGEPNDTETPLLPKLYRQKDDGSYHIENRLLQHFRMKAPSLGISGIPGKEKIDEWLFLAQHVGLPTRLLDWTEGLVFALFFALKEYEPVVWMLDPIELNRIASGITDWEDNVFPLTWVDREKIPPTRLDIANLGIALADNFDEGIDQKQGLVEKQRRYFKEIFDEYSKFNVGHANIKGAWQTDSVGVQLPIAIHPTNIHSRMSVQKSCFTVQGLRKQCLVDLVNERVLKKYIIPNDKKEDFQFDIQMLGISESTVFPDLDGLAKELSLKF